MTKILETKSGFVLEEGVYEGVYTATHDGRHIGDRKTLKAAIRLIAGAAKMSGKPDEAAHFEGILSNCAAVGG